MAHFLDWWWIWYWEASKHFSMVYASVSSSRFLSWVPSFHDGLGHVDWNNLSSHFWWWGLISSIEILRCISNCATQETEEEHCWVLANYQYSLSMNKATTPWLGHRSSSATQSGLSSRPVWATHTFLQKIKIKFKRGKARSKTLTRWSTHVPRDKNLKQRFYVKNL